MAEFAQEIVDLGEKIVSLTIKQGVELRDYLKEKYKIEPAVGGGGGFAPQQGGPTATAAPAAAAEPTEFKVVLESYDAAKKINVIKVVREITQLGLKEAKEVVEGAPKPIKEGLSKEDAAKIAKQLEDGGAKASIKPM
jgi:large subunit ribosomal protein L7/L12